MNDDNAQNYGLVISEPGFDADTAAPENTVFDTRYDTPKALIDEKLVTVGRLSFVFSVNPPVGTRRLKTITHNFGYTPLYFSYFDRKASSSFLASFGYTTGEIWLSTENNLNFARIIVRATDTELRFDYLRESGNTINMVGKTVTLNYYLFSNDVEF